MNKSIPSMVLWIYVPITVLLVCNLNYHGNFIGYVMEWAGYWYIINKTADFLFWNFSCEQPEPYPDDADWVDEYLEQYFSKPFVDR